MADVRFDLRGFDRMLRILRQDAKSGPVDAMLRQWAERYRNFTRRRFNRYARGGGDWAPLAPSTLRGRRGPKRRKTRSRRARTRTTTRGSARRTAILIDTGTLRKALTLGQPGSLEERLRKGIRVGFGGPARHPEGKASIADIATFHDEGSPRRKLPKRQILAEPDTRTINGMKKDAVRAVDTLGRLSEV